MAAAAAAGNFAKMAAGGMAVAAQAVGRVAQRVAAVGAAFAGGLIFKGMQGTQEADDLSNAFSTLALVIADVFAPAVRAVTQGIVELSSWFVSLDESTKANILSWTLLAAGVGGVIALLPVLKAGLSALSGIFSVLSAKIVLIPALILGVIAGILLLVAEGDTFEERSVGALTIVIRMWASLKASLLTVWEVLKGIGKGMYRLLTGDFEGAWEAISSEMKDGIKRVWAEAQQSFSEAPRTAQNVVNSIKDITNKVTGMGEAIRNMAGDDTPLGRIAEAFKNNRPLQLKAEVSFQSGYSMWQQTLKSVVESGKSDVAKQLEEVRQARMNLEKINREGVMIKGGPRPVVH